ncbi:cytotoxic T-lymphocyte protein 4 [Bombina bombina]|uniref:cytotoxic T-lymphocyte protein 4 n=1 Tax=Bombina bombina TaxID=8345 RepID=UPI00235AF8BD|nr:cytotoxic T-lymphocyte protein 4 [Bombina bombina]
MGNIRNGSETLKVWDNTINKNTGISTNPSPLTPILNNPEIPIGRQPTKESSFTINSLITIYTLVREGIKVTHSVLARHGNATLVCGYKVLGKVEEIRFSLLKIANNQITEICAASYSKKYEPFVTGDDILCKGIPGPSNVTLQISGLQTPGYGIYSYKIEVMYPPPYRTMKGNATFIYVPDALPEAQKAVDPVESVKSDLYKWVLLAICLGILFYSIVVTSVLLFSKLRKKKWNIGLYEKMVEGSQEKHIPPYFIRVD